MKFTAINVDMEVTVSNDEILVCLYKFTMPATYSNTCSTSTDGFWKLTKCYYAQRHTILQCNDTSQFYVPRCFQTAGIPSNLMRRQVLHGVLSSLGGADLP